MLNLNLNKPIVSPSFKGLNPENFTQAAKKVSDIVARETEMNDTEKLIKKFATRQHSGVVNPLDILPEVAKNLGGKYQDFTDSLKVMAFLDDMFKKEIMAKGREITQRDKVSIDHKVTAAKKAIPAIVEKMREGLISLSPGQGPLIKEFLNPKNYQK